MGGVNVKLKDGSIKKCEKGERLIDLAKQLYKDNYKKILVAKVDNELTELCEVLNDDCTVEFLDLSSYEARRIYARSLSFVLIRAAMEVFPGCTITIEHSINKGLYGELHKSGELDENDVKLIEDRMKQIINDDVPLEKRTISLENALEMFSKYGQKDKLRLFKYWNRDTVDVYKCGWMYDYFYGHMVPSTGYLKMFELVFYKPGFVLRYPEVYAPDRLPEYVEQKKLFSIFREAEEWAKILDVADVGALNDKVTAKDMGNIIRVSEALHEKKVAKIADIITEKKDNVKLVLISGPSSSGKTTFSKRLAVQLRVNGLKPYAISLDDYFLSREQTPKKPSGEPDFESIYALDLKLINEHFTRLLNGEEVMLPTFNFKTGSREYRGGKLKLTNDMILIAEGIHGLNEVLTSEIPAENKFKIYVSALTQLNIDNHNRIPTTDVRILRRIVRDNRTRGRDAERTLLGWASVREGEDKNVFPFQEQADVMFNSTLVYELGVLKNYAEPLLKQINRSSSAYSEASRLLNFLNYFLPVDESAVPQNSIIREFIGNSCFYDE